MNPVAVQFSGDSKPFFAELSKVRNELGGLRGEMKRVSDSISSGFRNIISGIGIASMLRAVVKETAAAEAAQAQLNNALQAAGANVKLASAEFQAYASQLQRTTTFGDEAIMQVETLLLSFRGLSGETVKQATAAVLDLSTRMGMDAPSAAKLLGKALADPEKGLTALTRAGVVFSDGQKAQITAMKESGNLAGAQGVILKGLEERFGGAAAAARNTFGGALAGLKNSFGDLLEGKGGINEASSGINALADTLSSPGVQQGFATIIAGLAKFIELSAKAASKVPAVATSIAEGLAKITNGPLPTEMLDLDEIESRLQKLQRRRAWHADGDPKWITEETKAVIASLDEQIAKLKEREAFLKGLPASTTKQPTDKGALKFNTGGVSDDDSEPGGKKKPVGIAALDIASQINLNELNLQLSQERDMLDILAADAQEISDRMVKESAAQVQESLDSQAEMRSADMMRQMQEEQNLQNFKVERERETQASIMALRVGTANAGIGLLALLAQKSKAAAIALIAIEKARAIGQAIRNTGVAVTNIMATVPFYGWGPAIASAKALGAAQIGLIAATGALEIGNVLGGGGSGSTIAAPSNNFSSATAAAEQERGVSPQNVTQIHLHGDVYGVEDLRRFIGDVLSEGANQRDIVYFSANSRQAQEIREG